MRRVALGAAAGALAKLVDGGEGCERRGLAEDVARAGAVTTAATKAKADSTARSINPWMIEFEPIEG